MKSEQDKFISACIIGQPDFCRLTIPALKNIPTCKNVVSGNIIEAWSLIIENRPNFIIFEIGFNHDPERHQALNNLLSQIKERFTNEIFVALYSSNSEKFSYTGDLLYKNKEDTKGSDLIDALLFNPPASVADYPDMTEQLPELVSLAFMELKTRLETGRALPKLNNEDWIQSQADPKSRELWMRWLPRYASYTNESPLIIGETGSGKTKVAYALHKLSERKGKFVSITPRDFSSSELVQAELFGAVAGAYTGAVDKWGLVKSAEKGTLFIDELQSIDKDLQGKLITFIENKAYRRVGSTESIDADVRFIFASNQSIDQMITSNILREDFAYRLERVQLQLQPLRSRKLDIAAALAYALSKIHRQRPNSSKIIGYTSGAYRIMFNYQWPGNLRQLENMVAQLCDLADIEGKNLIEEKHILQLVGAKTALNSLSTSDVFANAASEVLEKALLNKLNSLQESLDSFAASIRLNALSASSGDAQKAAELISDSSVMINCTASDKKHGRLIQ